MIDTLRQLHLLRPEWLVALVPLLLLCCWLMRRGGRADSAWQRALDPELLPHLMDTEATRPGRLPLLLGAGWLIAVLALAGPTWEKLPQPVLQQRDALVVVLDLSLSMYASDITPTRLQRARFKLHDLLNRRQEGLTGLVVYAGDAHIVAPLTDDTATIANLLPALSPDLMPVYGSDPVAGVAAAGELLVNAEVTQGRILLMTDDLTEADLDTLPAQLGNRWQLSILGVGTTEGAPVKLGDGLLRDRAGHIVIPQLPRDRLQALAQATGGRYSDLRVDEADLDYLLPAPGLDAELSPVERHFDQWRERGHWLVLLLLPIAALAARRGWLLSLVVGVALTALPPPSIAQAQTTALESSETEPVWQAALRQQWRDLWRRPDQQGAAAFDQGRMSDAAQQFADPNWRGSALYEAGDYAAAAEAFGETQSADALYNRGNALAQAGHYRQALVAYDAALQRDPEHQDAAANRNIVAEALQREVEPERSQRGNPSPSGTDSQENPGNDSPADAEENQQEAEANPQGDAQGNQGNPDQADPQSESSDSAGGAAAGTDADSDDERNSADHAASDQASSDQADSQPASSREQPAEESQPAPAVDREADQESTTAIAGAPADSDSAEDAAVERWLRRIPDDPGGLLRRKFEYESRQRAGERPRRDPDQPLW